MGCWPRGFPLACGIRCDCTCPRPARKAQDGSQQSRLRMARLEPVEHRVGCTSWTRAGGAAFHAYPKQAHCCNEPVCCSVSHVRPRGLSSCGVRSWCRRGTSTSRHRPHHESALLLAAVVAASTGRLHLTGQGRPTDRPSRRGPTCALTAKRCVSA